ncbi:hypothetical protein HJC23_002690 [Cyclotella cryptica]|uniref:Uncharacterized protein n=1 Tax=Cyclotella cryptica TaxID=29204 RepID=A0ABD3NTL8_9STRA|eukprot:CCRYP_020010-RA/>CCRYP_020010-RA protein AED:0.25 eAED:0.25 QI:0/-1/0/1/-1/1/1/0/204
MSKSKNNAKATEKSPIAGPKPYSKKTQQKSHDKSKQTKSKVGGIDEIDSLFAAKKESTKLQQKQLQQEEESAKAERKRRKEARLQEEAEEMVLRGSASTASMGASSSSKRKADASAPPSLHSKAQTLASLTYTRTDLQQLNNDKNGKEQKDKWASDGLGGVFNGEGYTGRRDEGGHRVFKAHLMNKEGFGTTKDCPFDCDCCFI